jgi:hypothetical protein
MWQQGSSPDEMPWSAAPGYCEALEVGGYSDWRLPTIIELRSIVDFARTDPAIHFYFSPVEQNRRSFWSATPQSSEAFSVNFVSGWSTSDTPYGTAGRMGVRCAR